MSSKRGLSELFQDKKTATWAIAGILIFLFLLFKLLA